MFDNVTALPSSAPSKFQTHSNELNLYIEIVRELHAARRSGSLKVLRSNVRELEGVAMCTTDPALRLHARLTLDALTSGDHGEAAQQAAERALHARPLYYVSRQHYPLRLWDL